MSDEPESIKVKVIEQPVTGEVWWIAALVDDSLPPVPYYTNSGTGAWSATQFPTSDDMYEVTGEALDRSMWFVSVMGDASATTIRVTAPADQEKAWIERLERIDYIAAVARHQRQKVKKVTAEDVIVRYYHLKRIGRETTIKQLAQEYNFNENYLYQVKALYDKSDKSADLKQGYVSQAYKVSEEP